MKIKLINCAAIFFLLFYLLQTKIALAIPTLGTYPSTNVTTGFDTVAVPFAVPSGTTSILVTTSSSFTGLLTADPVTGIVRIINPKPAGNYVVTVNAGSGVTQSFNLTVLIPSCSQGSFTGPVNYSMGTNPYHVSIGDFNNDGLQDVVTSNYGSGNISVRLGNGLGGFSNAINYSSGTNAIASAVGDLNGDGNQDIVVANWGASGFIVRLGDGTGSFGNAFAFSTAANPSSVAIGDFNNDGMPDIACANAGAATVSIRLGNGTGTSFTGSTNVSVGTTPRTVVIGDFNNDGNRDIATANYGSGNISVRLGNGTGAFTGTTTLAAGTNPYGLAVGDFNGDGIQDLVAANWSSPDISIRLGDGTGNFTNTANSITASNLSSVAVCDLNSDGIQDLVCGRNLSGSLAIRYGIGNGTLSGTYIINVGSPYFTAVGDFNGDGRQDIVSPDYNGNQVSVLLATENIFQVTSNGNSIPNGNTVYATSNNTDFGNVFLGNLLNKTYSLKNTSPFTNVINSINISGINASQYSINGISFPATINSGAIITFNIQFAPNTNGNQFASIHINQNNCPLSQFRFDIRGAGVNQNIPVVGNYRDTAVYAGGNLSIPPDSVPSNTSPVSVSAPPEFEGLLTLDPFTGVINITNAKPSGDYLISLSSGSLVLKTFLLHVTDNLCSPGMFNPVVNYAGTVSAYGVALGDFNADGIQDIIGTGYIKLGMGNGNFGTTTSVYMGANPLSVAIADFNNDGHQDVVAGNNNTNAVCIRLGNGAGGFLDTITLAAGSFSYGVVAADFNRDGITDIATTNNGANTVTVLAGLSSGSFIVVATVAVGTGPVSIVSGDFNSDGNIDFATANKTGGNISVRFGNGLGSFSGTSNISVGVNPSSIAKADFNKDGNSDLVISNSGANTISVLTGNGAGGFINSQTVNANYPPVAVTTGDFNGDGYADIAAALNINRLYLIAGDGSGGFMGNTIAYIGYNALALAVGDFNKDGKEDIVSTNTGSSGISILTANDSGAIVQGLLNYIIDGRTNVDPNDNTDYGIVPTGNALVHAFSFNNLGIAPLTISTINLTGLNPGEFSISGISFPVTVPGGSGVSFNVTFSPSSGGIKNAGVQVTYAHCGTKNFNFVVQGQGLVQSLGAYRDTTVVAGGNIAFFPDAPPAGLTKLNAKVVGNFSGVLSVSPVTGRIQITDAKPAGTYTVQLFATGFLIRSFTLVVQDPDCSSGYFENASDLLFGTAHPIAQAVCDINNDGIQDLISVNYSSNNISVRLGDGFGGFSGTSFYTAGTNPQAIAVADFNGDGNQDVALANNPGTVSIRLGNGSGGFPGIVTSTSVQSNPNSLATGDFNNDGIIDMLVTNYSSSSVSLLIGNGLGAFSVSSFYVPSPRSVITDDFNKDGKMDFACALFQSSGVSVFLGDNAGGFANSGVVPVNAFPTSIAAADFNQDGFSDMVVVSSTAANILMGNGLGGFTVTSTLTLAAGSNYVAVGDFDGDGREDIAITNINTSTFSVWLGYATGGFTNTSTFTCGAGTTGILVGDFNADRKEDLALVNNTSNSISVRLGSDNALAVTGNANSIVNGTTSVSVLQNTDFGAVVVNSGLLKDYTIQNKGAAPVTINSIGISGPNASDFSLPAISLPVVIPGNSNLTFNVLYSPLATGISNANVSVNITTCTTYDFVFAISGAGYIYTPGIYPSTTVIAGGNTTVNPSMPTGGATSLSTVSPSGFTGILFVEPSTGIVTVTNAKPEGIYTVTVTTNTGQAQTFSLTVTKAACSQASFSSTNYSITGAAKCVIGDFNRDGNQDVAVASTTGNSISIRLGDGMGGISGNSSFPAGTGPEFIVTGDFNNDGKLDLACTNANTPNIIICLGDGNGGFTTLPALVLTGTCAGISCGDFNKDGNTDIAVANSTGNSVLIRLGNGTGYFSGTTDVSVGSSPRGIAIADFNNDGNPDIAATNYSSGSVSVRFGNGLGGFSGTTTLTGGSNPYSIESADLNNDGNQDLVFSNYGSASVFIHLGNGSGGFASQPAVSVGTNPASLCVADFNGDGFLDFVTANLNTYTSSLRLGLGSGAFTSNVNTTISVLFSLGNIVAGDFNNDGRFDLVTSNSGGTISILTNQANNLRLTGKGNVIPDGSLIYSNSNNTDFGIAAVGNSKSLIYNFINNGATSVVVNNISFAGLSASEFSVAGISFPTTLVAGGTITFSILFNPASAGIKNVTALINYDYCQIANYAFALQGTGVNIVTGNYQNATLTAGGNTLIIPGVVPQNSGGLYVTTSKRFTGIVTIEQSTGNIAVTNAQPAGVYTFTVIGIAQINEFTLTVLDPICSPGTFSITSPISNSANPFVSAVGDFNRDGKQDLVVAVSNSIKINLGDGSGGFTTASSLSLGNRPNSIVVSDFNNDGIQDLAVSNQLSNSVSICRGNSSGGFSVTSSISTSGTTSCVATGDFNGDFIADLAIAVIGTNSVLIRLGDGLGGFTSAPSIATGTPQSVVVGDFNNDNKPDLAIANYSSNTVSIKLGDGLGGFPGATTLSASTAPSAIKAGDFNGDGNTDLVCSNSGSGTISVYLGDGAGGFSAQTLYTTGSSPASVAVGDFNGDANQDLAVSNSSSGTVSIRFGNGQGLFSGSTNLTTGTNPYSVVAGDFNSDGVMDLAAANYNSNTVSILTGTNTGNITVTGNGLGISNGSQVTSVANNTNLGSIIANSPVAKNYVFQNASSNSCQINSIMVSGVDSTAFIVSGIALPITVAAGGSISFDVTFTPVSNAVYNAAVNIGYDICVAAGYIFAIQGTGLFDCNINIDDNDICTIDACDSLTGVSHTPVNADDGNACTIDICFPNAGVINIPVDPDDGNPCTVDGCDPLTGIYHHPAQEICGNGIDDNCDGMIDEHCNLTLNLHLFIEGFYLGNNTMRATIDPVNYPSLCDTVTVELHESIPPFGFEHVDRQAIDIGGMADFYFPYSALNKSHFIVIRHRNAIETWSAAPVLFNDSSVYYSFTDSVSKAFGNNQFDLDDGNFALWSGDISDMTTATYGIQDGIIELRDFLDMEVAVQQVVQGYTVADITGDGTVESLDYSIIGDAAYFMIVSMRP